MARSFWLEKVKLVEVDPESGKLNRRKMIVSEMPTVATQIVLRDLNDFGLSVTDAVTSHKNIPTVKAGEQSHSL